MLEKIKELSQEQLGIGEEAAAAITEETSFREDLNADSLDLYELVSAIEEEFNVEIPDEDVEKIETVGDAIAVLKSLGA